MPAPSAVDRRRGLNRIRIALSRRFRRRRMALFLEQMEISPRSRVVDVGGHARIWAEVEPRPMVVLVNLDPARAGPGGSGGLPVLPRLQGDGRRLACADNAFDVAFSNSVIEHIGDWDDQVAFAREIARVAPRYFVQTPNRKFPVEPHTLAPFLHFLPRRWQPALVRWFSVWGWLTRPTRAEADAFLADIRLLSVADMQRLFPDATIVRERFCGLTKSIVAMRR